jgi:hypothetical protein
MLRHSPSWSLPVRPLLLLLLSCLPVTAPAGTSDFGPPQRLDPLAVGDGAVGDQFGGALARDGATLVVAARQLVLPSAEAAEGVQSGAVFVYEDIAGSLQPVQRLLPPLPGEGDLFGESVALSGDLLLVGAGGVDAGGIEDRGSAHVFRRAGATFVHEAELAPPVPAAGQRFGTTVRVVDATTIAVGMPRGAVGAAAEAGQVVVFRRVAATWSAVATLQSPDAAAGDGFGAAIAAHGDRLLVGVPGGDAPGAPNAGRVEVFDTAGAFPWLGRLEEAQAAADARFGASLRLDADLALVGAPGNLAATRGFVRAYVRSGGTFGVAERIAASDALSGDGFGFALDRVGDTLLVGAPGRFQGAGGGYVFSRVGGSLVQRALLEDRSTPEGDGLTGVAVALFGTRALLGADLAVVLPNRAQGLVRVWTGADATWTAAPRIDRGDGVAGEFFGTALSVDGNRVAVGAYLDDTAFGGDDAGTVTLFTRGDAGWTRSVRLDAFDGAPEDWFGRSVALAGDWLLVGAPRDITSGVADTGSAYLFRRVAAGWTFSRKLVPSDAVSDDGFGLALAFDGRRLVVSAPGRDDGEVDRGGAYAWTLLDDGTLRFDGKLVPASVPAGGLAGIALALQGDLLAMGAPQATVQGRAGRGMVARFRWNGSAWAEIEPVIAADGATGDLFGNAVALSPDGTRLAVGAPGVRIDAMNGGAGAAYVFRLDAPVVQEARLLPAERQAGAGFGVAVALDDARLAVGASGEDIDGAANRGRVHLWRRDAGAWAAAGTLEPADAIAQSFYGRSLSRDVGLLAVGGPLRATAVNPAAGSAWMHPDADALFADGFD